MQEQGLEARSTCPPSGSSIVLLFAVNISSFALYKSVGFYDLVGLLAYVLVSILLVLSLTWQSRLSSQTLRMNSWNRALYFSAAVTATLNLLPPVLRFMSNALASPLTRLPMIPVFILVMFQHPKIIGSLSARKRGCLLILTATSIFAIFLMVPVVSPDPFIDVVVVFQESAEALLRGENPYQISYTNIYYPDVSGYPRGEAKYYPYPPLTFLLGLIGLILNDVRWLFILAHCSAAVLLFMTARSRTLSLPESFTLALLYAYIPMGLFVAESAWSDPILALSLAFFSYLLARKSWLKALISFSFALALKQTTVVLLPLLVAFWPRARLKQLALVLVVPVTTFVPFLLWDWRAMFQDLVYFHSATPFRPDGLTLSSFVYRLTGSPFPFSIALLPLALTLGLGIRRLRLDLTVAEAFSSARTATLWSGFGCVFLLTLLFSKHAFANYYYFLHFLLVVSLLWSRIADQEIE